MMLASADAAALMEPSASMHVCMYTGVCVWMYVCK